MRKITVKLIELIVIAEVIGFSLPYHAFAQAKEAVGLGQEVRPPMAGEAERPPGWDEGEKVGWGDEEVPPGLLRLEQERKELERLRQEDPEEFKSRIKYRKKRLRERLKRLKERYPERYEELIRYRRRQQRERYLKRLKEENPEEYDKVIRRYRQKIRRHREKHPEYHDRLKRLHQLRKDKDYDGLREFLRRHPDIRHNWLRELTPEEIRRLKLTPRELNRLRIERPEVFERYLNLRHRRKEAPIDRRRPHRPNRPRRPGRPHSR